MYTQDGDGSGGADGGESEDRLLTFRSSATDRSDASLAMEDVAVRAVGRGLVFHVSRHVLGAFDAADQPAGVSTAAGTVGFRGHVPYTRGAVPGLGAGMAAPLTSALPVGAERGGRGQGRPAGGAHGHGAAAGATPAPALAAHRDGAQGAQASPASALDALTGRLPPSATVDLGTQVSELERRASSDAPGVAALPAQAHPRPSDAGSHAADGAADGRALGSDQDHGAEVRHGPVSLPISLSRSLSAAVAAGSSITPAGNGAAAAGDYLTDKDRRRKVRTRSRWCAWPGLTWLGYCVAHRIVP